MAWRSGSLSRTLLSTARSSSFRSAPPLPRLRPSPPLAAPRPSRSRLTFAHPRNYQVARGAWMHAVSPSTSQRGGGSSPHIPPVDRFARLLRAVSGEEWKRWVMQERLGIIGTLKRMVSQLQALYLNSCWDACGSDCYKTEW